MRLKKWLILAALLIAAAAAGPHIMRHARAVHGRILANAVKQATLRKPAGRPSTGFKESRHSGSRISRPINPQITQISRTPEIAQMRHAIREICVPIRLLRNLRTPADPTTVPVPPCRYSSI